MEFPSGCLADDEETARHFLDGDLDHLPSVSCRCGRRLYVGVSNPARVLAEVAAKRRIIAQAQDLQESVRAGGFVSDDEIALTRDTLLALAQPYADRPGWDEGWRL